MAYESVLWTAKTGVTWDKLAQMQQNIDEIKAMIDGTNAYVENTARGIGKGILHYQELTTPINCAAGVWTQVGQTFIPVTEAGRLYQFECFIPRMNTYDGLGIVRLLKDGSPLQVMAIGMATNIQLAFIFGLQANFYGGSGTISIHISPGASTSSSYKVDCIPLFSGAAGLVAGGADVRPWIKFTDIGPA